MDRRDKSVFTVYVNRILDNDDVHSVCDWAEVGLWLTLVIYMQSQPKQMVTTPPELLGTKFFKDPEQTRQLWQQLIEKGVFDEEADGALSCRFLKNIAKKPPKDPKGRKRMQGMRDGVTSYESVGAAWRGIRTGKYKKVGGRPFHHTQDVTKDGNRMSILGQEFDDESIKGVEFSV